jgi:iron complex outermembrane recepter protein
MIALSRIFQSMLAFAIAAPAYAAGPPVSGSKSSLKFQAEESADQPVSIQTSEPIVVTGRTEASSGVSFESRHALDAEQIAALAATSADVILQRLPSVHVPTNSRGETIAFVRNAGERQVALFYDGAAINVPWDNRLDLSMLPAGLIGGVRSASGPLAPHYGVNAVGAISLSPQDIRSGIRGLLVGGSRDTLDATLLAKLATNPIGLVLGGSVTKSRGDVLLSSAILPFWQNASSSTRTNTDQDLASAYGIADGALGRHRFSLTAFHVWGAKGIAPEGDREKNVRFWRYPSLKHTLATLSVNSNLGAETDLSSTIWVQLFAQTIDSYADIRYDQVTARQSDRDLTWGLRELLTHRAGDVTFVGSLNLLQSTHRQRDVSVPAALSAPSWLAYSQHNLSLGGEIAWQINSRIVGEIGVGLDLVDYRRTGDKPTVSDIYGWTGRTGIIFDIGDGWRIRGSAGRKLRSPTMRELFGQTLSRFLINPDLRPERISTVELGVEWQGQSGRLFVIPFFQDVIDTIDQRNVGRLRQRVNLVGSHVIGLEMGGSWLWQRNWSVSGAATWSEVARKGVSPGQSQRIAEKPELLARFTLSYGNERGFGSDIEVEHIGRAYSADVDGLLVPLPRATSLNWRLYQDIKVGGAKVNVALRVDNLTDSLIEPQLGLPSAGRTIRVVLKVN